MKIITKKKSLIPGQNVPTGSLIRIDDRIYLVTGLYRDEEGGYIPSTQAIITSKRNRLVINLSNGDNHSITPTKEVEIVEGELTIC